MVKETGNSEFIVESILRGKVCKKDKRRRQKKQWLFWVKWQGYEIADNTWEPYRSFEGGSEHFVIQFWQRVNLDGRDPLNLSDFAEGEEFFPTGPPRGKPREKKAKAKAANPASPPPPEEAADSEAEVKSLIGSQDAKQNKRRGLDAVVDGKSLVQGRPPNEEADEEPASSASKLTRKRSVPGSMSKSTSASGKRVASSSTSKANAKRRISSSSPARESSKRPRFLRKESSPDEILLVAGEPMKDVEPAPTEASTDGLQVEAALTYPDSPASPALESLFGGDDNDEPIDEVASSQEDEKSVEPIVAPPSPFRSTRLLNAEPAPSPPLRPQTTSPPAPPAIPYHRVRAANPRIKLMEDPRLGGHEGAIAAKAKFMKRGDLNSTDSAVAAGPSTIASSQGGTSSLPRRARSSVLKPGPGRCSVGFGGNGASAVILSSPRAAGPSGTSSRENGAEMNNNHQGAELANTAFGDDADGEISGLGNLQAPMPQDPPTAQELLQLAGLNAGDAEALADFEEDAAGEVEADVVSMQDVIPAQQEVVPVPESRSVAVEEKPAPAANRLSAAWMRSTIFGPLGLGLDIPSTPVKEKQESSERPRSALFLSLDSSVSLPVLLLDVQPRGSFLDKLGKRTKGPPGKFYKDRFALALLDCLQVEGSAARLSLAPEADETQKEHFKRFCTRVKEAELFLEMTGTALVAMCSSENQIVGQKLGMPLTLVGLADSVLVAHVTIMDYSAYADAVIHADDVRW